MLVLVLVLAQALVLDSAAGSAVMVTVPRCCSHAAAVHMRTLPPLLTDSALLFFSLASLASTSTRCFLALASPTCRPWSSFSSCRPGV